MTARILTDTHFSDFWQYLQEDEREPSTIRKYLRDVQAFATWIGEEPVTKEQVSCWKENLQKTATRRLQ